MACKVTTVPFRGTKEQEEQLLAVIEELRDTPGALMPIMQRAQDIYGYLPIEVQTIISDKTGILIGSLADKDEGTKAYEALTFTVK